MMRNGGLKMRKKSVYSWGLFILLLFSIFGEISLLEIYLQSSNEDILNISENSQSFYDVPRLRSDQPVFQNESNSLPKSLNSLNSLISERNQSSSSTEFSSGDRISLPLFQLNGDPDLNITKISPEAMEKNASSMTFILNFTIPGEIGLGIGTLVNLTLNNASDNLLITSYAPTDWVELTNETGFFIDQYSLTFTLNNSFISKISFGSYDLSMYIDVSGYQSSDSVPLPMRDVWVKVVSVTPPEFNNKLDTDQFFNVEIEARNYTSSSSFYYVDSLPAILDANGVNINPKAIVESVPAGVVGLLQFEGFIVNNTSQGRFTLNYSLSASVAQDFEDGDHQLIISVTTLEWISDNASTQFAGKGTVYHVILEELTVENNPPLDYDTLTAGTQDDIVLRLNVNDSVNITFHVYDTEQQTNSTRVHDIQYQDPNKPEDPTALFSKSTNDVGVGSINLTANDVTYSGGYTLLFFVRGHRTSQENEKPSNITIFWDLLYYDYTYYDNQGNTGSSASPNQKALGVDVNENWTLELSLYYASDDTTALGGNISYRFGGGIWYNQTDGSGNPLNGLFNISHKHLTADEVLFECKIISGSSFDPQGTLFVDKTVSATEFSLTVTWTYLIIEMISGEPDQRLSTLIPTYIYLNAKWAHNEILGFDGILVVKDYFWSTQRPVSLFAGEGNLTGLVNINNGSYRYSVVSFDDDVYGITKFTNSSILDIENQPYDKIKVDIIWESILFTYSNIFTPSDPPNQSIPSFFANHGEDASLYIYGRHSYDNSPFNGKAVLYAFEIAEPYTLEFINGVANWTDDLTEHGFEISFGIMEIYEDTDYGVLSVGTYESVIISWDKIVITLEANLYYSHGTWANISVTYSYLVYDTVPVYPNNVTYSILLSNETTPRVDVSWEWFLDFSLGPAKHTYIINDTDIFDASTGLSKAEVRYRWLDQDMDPEVGDLTVYWIDDKEPTIVELHTYDLGNGSIIIVLDVIDDSENWVGSGIEKVELFDERELVQAFFLKDPVHVLLPSGIHRYYFMYSYDQLIDDDQLSSDYFQFEFGEPLSFFLRITEYGTPDFLELPEDLRNPRTLITDSFVVIVDYDPYHPEFISKNGTDITVFYPKLNDTLTTKPTITDGDVIVTVYIQDSIWSGINRSFVQLIVIDLENNVTYEPVFMVINDDSIPLRGELQFNWAGTFSVGGTFRLTVIITDGAGNYNSRTVEVTIEDHVAPRVKKINIKETDDRKLKIEVTIEETGFGVDFISVGILDSQGNLVQWVNLSRQVIGGSGGSINQLTEIYSATVVLPFEPLDFVTPKQYSIKMMVADLTGNRKLYSSDELKAWGGDIEIDGSFDPLIFHPLVLFVGAIILIFGIIVGIRITSKVEGYDMKRIFTEGEKISREVILTQMDEYALGVTVNFFDQVQGPVPVIWEPALLEDQEQVMLDLSDKSFSTLQFIGLEETERSGTFDFSTGSYDCTALGYSFSVVNPKARGGKENLTVVLLLRKEWGDNLLVFQDELTEKLREIRKMIETQQHASHVEKKARELREFVSRLMLSFNKIYAGMDYELEFQEE